jgi:hypothetical protein
MLPYLRVKLVNGKEYYSIVYKVKDENTGKASREIV